MKHWSLLVICTSAILWTATQAFAGTGAACPTTVNGQTDAITCAGTCTGPSGQAGTCVPSEFPATSYNPWGMAVYKWDAATSKWVPDGTFTTGMVKKCGCKFNIGTPEEPIWVTSTDACCDAASDPTKPGKVIKWGTCDHPNCQPLHPNCSITGTRTAAEGECKD